MSLFEVYVLIGMALIFLALSSIAITIEKWTRHLSNIADRLLDIENKIKNRN